MGGIEAMYRRALEDFNKAIEINSNLVENYSNRGIIKMSLKDFKGSVDDFTKAVEIDPNDHEHKLGSSFMQAFAMFPPELIDEPKDPKRGMLSSLGTYLTYN